jgi:hypothetical protein
MKYESIKHSFLIILIATTIVGCAGNSVQPPTSQYQTSNSTLNGKTIDSQDDTSSIDVVDVDKEAIANQECQNLFMCQISPPEQSLGKIRDTIITTAVVTGLVAVTVAAPEVVLMTFMLFAPLLSH